MGRIFFFSLLFLLASFCPALADTSYQISVTATVLPSPEWINLVQTHSPIHRIELPFLNLVVYQITLTDGKIFFKNHPVTITAVAGDRNVTQTLETNREGLVQFLLPDNFTLTSQPDFNFNSFL